MTDTTINDFSYSGMCKPEGIYENLAVDSTPLTRSHASLGRGLKLEGGY